MNTSKTKIFFTETDMLSQKYQIKNMFGPSFPNMGVIAVAKPFTH